MLCRASLLCGLTLAASNSLTQFQSSFKVGHILAGNLYPISRPRISTYSWLPVAQAEAPEATDFCSATIGEIVRDRVQYEAD